MPDSLIEYSLEYATRTTQKYEDLMKIYTKHAVLALSPGEVSGKVFIEIAPAFGGTIDGLKSDHEHFDYDAAIRIGLNSLGMLKASYRLRGMVHRHGNIEPCGIVTIANSLPPSGSKPSFEARLSGNGVDLTLRQDDKSYSLTLGCDEVYAIGMWFQTQAQKCIMQE
jgi:hypothetical protein